MSTRPVDAPPALDAAELIGRHQDDVWRYLRALGCDPALADDLTQDTFVALLESRFEFRSAAATAAWLRRTATSLLRKLLRRRRLAQVVVAGQLDAAEAAWERWHRRGSADDATAVSAALADCFERLTDRVRDALTLQFRERRTGEEIASALGMTHSNVRVLIHRARQTLRDCVERKVVE
ncbi:MAG: RNA polymerase sigma factor [Planctomycetota bacterium]